MGTARLAPAAPDERYYPVGLARRPPTQLERRVVLAIANGRTQVQIAAAEGLSGGAVKRTLDGIRHRIGAVNLPHLVYLAGRYGII